MDDFTTTFKSVALVIEKAVLIKQQCTIMEPDFLTFVNRKNYRLMVG